MEFCIAGIVALILIGLLWGSCFKISSEESRMEEIHEHEILHHLQQSEVTE